MCIDFDSGFRVYTCQNLPNRALYVPFTVCQPNYNTHKNCLCLLTTSANICKTSSLLDLKTQLGLLLEILSSRLPNF